MMLILQFLTLSQAVTSASNLPRNSGSILATSLVSRGLALPAALGTGGNAAKNISGKCIFFQQLLVARSRLRWWRGQNWRGGERSEVPSWGESLLNLGIWKPPNILGARLPANLLWHWKLVQYGRSRYNCDHCRRERRRLKCHQNQSDCMPGQPALHTFSPFHQVEILGMLTSLTAAITEQEHGIDPWDSSGVSNHGSLRIKCWQSGSKSSLQLMFGEFNRNWMTFQIHPFPHDLTLLSGLADGATYMAKTDEIVTLNISTETGKPISYRVWRESSYLNIESPTCAAADLLGRRRDNRGEWHNNQLSSVHAHLCWCKYSIWCVTQFFS